MALKNLILKPLILIVVFLSSMISCGDDSETIDAILSKTESSSPTVSGRAQNTLDALSEVEQKFTYNELQNGTKSAISGSFIVFPAGSIVSETQDLEIFMEEGASNLHEKIKN